MYSGIRLAADAGSDWRRPRAIATDGASQYMSLTARAAIALIVSILLPAASMAQTGPSEPQVIAAASTAKISIGQKKLAGHAIATVRVGEDGHVHEVPITEIT